MSDFKVGDVVAWTAHSNGRSARREGEVIWVNPVLVGSFLPVTTRNPLSGRRLLRVEQLRAIGLEELIHISPSRVLFDYVHRYVIKVNKPGARYPRYYSPATTKIELVRSAE